MFVLDLPLATGSDVESEVSNPHGYVLHVPIARLRPVIHERKAYMPIRCQSEFYRMPEWCEKVRRCYRFKHRYREAKLKDVLRLPICVSFVLVM